MSAIYLWKLKLPFNMNSPSIFYSTPLKKVPTAKTILPNVSLYFSNFRRKTIQSKKSNSHAMISLTSTEHFSLHWHCLTCSYICIYSYILLLYQSITTRYCNGLKCVLVCLYQTLQLSKKHLSINKRNSLVYIKRSQAESWWILITEIYISCYTD